jgi:hypothetical protein
MDTVEEIIKVFRSGEHDQAEFWLEIDGKFIYIIYNAVRVCMVNHKAMALTRALAKFKTMLLKY